MIKKNHLHKHFESFDSNLTETEKVNPNLPKQDMAAKDTLGMDETETEISKLEHTFLKVSPHAKSVEPKQ